MSTADAAVAVTGATGLVGRRLVAALLESGTPVRALSRSPVRAAERLPPEAQCVAWNPERPDSATLRGTQALVHLAGEPVFAGPLTRARRQRIHSSRVDSTRALVRALGELPERERPRVFVCASAVGYYGSRGEQELDESAEPGEGFLARVCIDWEAAAAGAEALGLRRVSLRIGIVLARDGGALPRMALPFRFGLGGRLGSGRQWMPWIHVVDLVRLLRRVLEQEEFSGAVNAVAPRPVRNLELTRALARVLERPAWLPVPAFALRALLGELADELLGSRRVLPRAALARGFHFVHEELEAALAAELRPPSG